MSEPVIVPNCLTDKVDWNLTRNGVTWYKLFCANCGKSGGSVLENQLGESFAFYLCDDCYEKWGDAPGFLFVVPDAVFWRQVQQAQIEKYGRILSPIEVQVNLEDPSSLESRLVNERI